MLGIFDTHAARVASRNAETDAKLDKKASEIQIKSLQDQIAGLRQDGTTNARTFSDSFSQLNSKFSDLQSKVRNQDLMDQLASTRAELQATQKRLEPKPKAILESTFVGEGASSDPQTSKPLGRIGLTVHQRVTDASCGILGSRRCSVVLGSSPLRFKDFPV